MYKLNPTYQKYFEYLDAFRESGVTNMFGATPFVQEEFDLDKPTASKVLTLWMTTFTERLQADGQEIAQGKLSNEDLAVIAEPVFIAIGDMAWGKGTDKKKAIREMVAHLGKRNQYLLYRVFSTDFKVSAMGEIISNDPPQLIEKVGGK